ncbi:MAG: type IV secretion system DNA-binding domain-containing protein [Candidatus Thiodiazotropha sp. (ex Dulcina madagascariensis)]|nr:type IV secretion system DNA-binding domain-containing protein [Candidatus Thiodiazotropha sp. (ex Dulcina madagascariensis)]
MFKQSRNPVACFAHTNSRGKHIPFGIQYQDRLSHIYMIGKTGTGKTTLLDTLIMQDIENGHGVALIDPHGDFVDSVATRISSQRQKDIIYMNVPDVTQPYGYNPLKYVVPEYRPLAASGILEVFKKMWKDSWGQRLEHILRNAILALLESPHAQLGDILTLLVDKDFRKETVQNLENGRVRDFWLNEYENYSYRLRADAIVPIQNKVGAFLADPTLNRILTNPKQPINIRRIMDEGKILLVNLSKGRLGEDTAGLLGGLLVTTVGLAAFSRANKPENKRRDFYLYIDEFQNFTTLSIANMASELRKFHVGLVMAHQYLHQLDPDIRYAVLGNAGTLISFRLGGKDAASITREFLPIFAPEDLIFLPNYHIYLKLMINGAPSKPFSAETIVYDEAMYIQQQLSHRPYPRSLMS